VLVRNEADLGSTPSFAGRGWSLHFTPLRKTTQLLRSGDVFRYMEIFSCICHASFLLNWFFFVGSTQILMEQKKKTVGVTPWQNVSSQKLFSALCAAIVFFCLPDKALSTIWCLELRSFGDRQKIFPRLWIPWTCPRLGNPMYHI